VVHPGRVGRVGPAKRYGSVITKSSICEWGVLYKLGVYAGKVLCLTPGGLLCALGFRVRKKLAESKVTLIDPIGEVSRRQSNVGNRQGYLGTRIERAR
jgi:hypothetical protein